MTNEQKEAYQDCVKYLMQYAKAMEANKDMKKYCLDITKKAKLLHDLKPHLFYETGMKEEIEGRKVYYEDNEEYNTNSTES